MKKILSIDGGGIRGIIPAAYLAEIEKRTGKPICTLFDLIAGTSTGGILAAALTVPDSRPKTRQKTSMTPISKWRQCFEKVLYKREH